MKEQSTLLRLLRGDRSRDASSHGIGADHDEDKGGDDDEKGDFLDDEDLDAAATNETEAEEAAQGGKRVHERKILPLLNAEENESANHSMSSWIGDSILRINR